MDTVRNFAHLQVVKKIAYVPLDFSLKKSKPALASKKISTFAFFIKIIFLKNIKAHIALFAVALIYGANYTIAKEVLDPGHIKPIGFITLRITTGMVLFGLITTFFIKEKIKKEDWKLVILCALFGAVINQLCFFIGLEKTTAIHGALLLTVTPIIVLIASAILLREAITFRKTIGILIGMAGAAFLILSGKSISFHSEQIKGDLFVFINSVSYGLYLVLVRKLMKTYHPFTILSRMFAIGFLVVLPLGWSDLQEVEWSSFSGKIWLAVGYVLFFTTFLTYLLNATALKTVPATVAGIYIYLQPIIATLISVSFAKDVMSADKLISAILIFTGVYLVSKKKY